MKYEFRGNDLTTKTSISRDTSGNVMIAGTGPTGGAFAIKNMKASAKKITGDVETGGFTQQRNVSYWCE